MKRRHSSAFTSVPVDVVGVGVGLREDESLRHLELAPGVGAVGKDFGQAFLEGADDGADLRGIDDLGVELLRGVGLVVVLLLPTFRAGQLLALFDETSQHGAAGGGHLGLDQVDLPLHVHPVGDGFLVGVFRDEVLLEEAIGAAIRRGGESDEEGVEILQHLPPEVVDRAVAFIDDDEVEELGRDLFVVGDGERFLSSRSRLGGIRLVLALGHLAPLQNGIHPLNRGDADLGIGRDMRRGQPLGGVDRSEGSVVVGRRVGEELLLGLLAEVPRIDEEEDAFHPGVLEEPVDRSDRGEGFPRSRGHLHEGAGFRLSERGLEIRDRVDLAIAQPRGIERGQVVLEAAAQRFLRADPLAQRLGSVKGENLAGSWLRISLIGEPGEDTGRLVEKGQRHAGVLDPFQLRGRVIPGLLLDGGQILPERLFFRLDHPDGAAFHEEDVVGRTGIGRVFPNRLADALMELDRALVLHHPSRGAELIIDAVARDLLGILVRGRHERVGNERKPQTAPLGKALCMLLKPGR